MKNRMMCKQVIIMEPTRIHYLSPDHQACLVIYENLGEFQLTPEQFEQLWKQKPEEKGKVFVFGKEHDMPRYCQSFGKSYTFSKREHIAAPLESIVVENEPYLMKIIHHLRKSTGRKYNQALINWYPDNQSYIGAHSDDEEMFSDHSVVCFNFCKNQGRDIVIHRKKKNKYTKKPMEQMNPLKHLMKNNTGYAMEGPDFQNLYTHQVPKRASKPDQDERRISITIRVFKD